MSYLQGTYLGKPPTVYILNTRDPGRAKLSLPPDFAEAKIASLEARDTTPQGRLLQSHAQGLRGPLSGADQGRRRRQGAQSAVRRWESWLKRQLCRSELHEHHQQGGLRVCQAAMACLTTAPELSKKTVVLQVSPRDPPFASSSFCWHTQRWMEGADAMQAGPRPGRRPLLCSTKSSQSRRSRRKSRRSRKRSRPLPSGKRRSRATLHAGCGP